MKKSLFTCILAAALTACTDARMPPSEIHTPIQAPEAESSPTVQMGTPIPPAEVGVVRGGSFSSIEWVAKSSYSFEGLENSRGDDIGFRLAEAY